MFWVNYTRRAMSTTRVQYNDVYRILMKLPRYGSASSMYAEARIPDFFAIVRSRNGFQKPSCVVSKRDSYHVAHRIDNSTSTEGTLL
jgi:hypothetical protein